MIHPFVQCPPAGPASSLQSLNSRCSWPIASHRIAGLVFRSPFLYPAKTPEHTRTAAGDRDTPGRRCEVLPFGEKARSCRGSRGTCGVRYCPSSQTSAWGLGKHPRWVGADDCPKRRVLILLTPHKTGERLCTRTTGFPAPQCWVKRTPLGVHLSPRFASQEKGLRRGDLRTRFCPHRHSRSPGLGAGPGRCRTATPFSAGTCDPVLEADRPRESQPGGEQMLRTPNWITQRVSVTEPRPSRCA